METVIRRIASTTASAPGEPTEKERFNGYSSSDNDHSTIKESEDADSVKQTRGILRMEAFARATEGRKGVLIGLAVAVYICNWVSRSVFNHLELVC